jgi:hypothetical protein
MANTTVQTGAPPPQGLVARFFGIITSPSDTYKSVVAHPEWLGMLAICVVAATVIVGGFLFTKVGQDAWLDAASSNPALTDAQVQGMEKMAPMVGYFTVASMFVALPLISAIVAGILFAIFNAALGGNATFKQVFTVVVHAGAIGVLAQLFVVPMNYFRGTMTSATNLGVLLPMMPEGSFGARFLGMIDIFIIWQVIVLAIGLAVLYRRRTQPVAMSLLGVYLVIAVIAAFFGRGA